MSSGNPLKSLNLTTPPTRMAIGNDGWAAREKLVDAVSNLNAAVVTLQALGLPVNTPVVAHEWLNSYDASTGDFGQSQPAFSDISGVATPAQLPVASSSTEGIVQPDNTTITISAGVISAAGGVAIAPRMLQWAAAAGAATTTAAFGGPVSSGNTLVVILSSEDTATGGTLTDTVGTTWTLAASVTGHLRNLAIYVGSAAASGANTVSYTGMGGAYDNLIVIELYGALTTVDATATSYSTSGPYSLNVTTTAVDFVVFSTSAYYTATVFTLTGSLAQTVGQVNSEDATAFGVALLPAAGTYGNTVAAGHYDNNPTVIVALHT